MDKINRMCEIVELMDKHLRSELLNKNGTVQKKKLWENTFIKHQIERRNNHDIFSIRDHIKGMVYSMLSSGITWERVETSINESTGEIKAIDEIFYNYEPKILLKHSSDELSERIKRLHCASQSTRKQMTGLLEQNIPKLKQLEKEYGSIDAFYQTYINKDSTYKVLVQTLADTNSPYKMSQMGEALIAEYLRNVGYDMAKPDRHIRRILGSTILGCSEKEVVPIYEAFDIVREIAEKMNKPVAEVDYILWSYCAKGYGEICTKDNPNCKKCAVQKLCKFKGEN